ncbi:hypothetical protein H7X69_02150 [Candidatus Saccharibacteria bacterium]|nr:hypothetical protein [Candidatus Saccharibacteria bacterium]
MSETLPSAERTLSAKEVISQFEDKQIQTVEHINAAQSKVDELNFNSDAIDHVNAKTELRDARATYQPEADTLNEEWLMHGGERLDAARTAVESLNFKSTAEDHIYAKKELQSAEDTWVASLNNANKESSNITDGEQTPSAIETGFDSLDDGLAEAQDAKDASDDANTSEHEDEIRRNFEPALEGESADEYETRNNIPNIDTLEDVVVSPVPGEQILAIDTLEGVVVNPIEGDLSAEDSEKEDSNQETGDADKLDEEKQSIWNKVKSRTKGLYLKVGTLYSTTLFTAGNFMPTPKQKSEETKGQFETRVKRYGAAKIVGVVALIVAAKYGLPLLNGGEAQVSEVGPGMGSGAGAEVVEAAGVSGGSDGIKVEVDPSAFSVEAHTVTRGEGWYNTFRELGIKNETEQANLLQKVGPELQARGWAYPTKNGSWGISHTGQLPENVLKLIKNSR